MSIDFGNLLGGLLGGAAGASSAASNNANAGHVNMTTTTAQTPWGPADSYIQNLMQMAYNDIPGDSAAYGGTTPLGAGQPSSYVPLGGAQAAPTTSPAGTGSGPLRLGATASGINPPKSATFPLSSPAGSASPAGGGAASNSFTGESATTQAAINALMAAAGRGQSVYQGAAGLVNQYAAGQDPDAYRSTTFNDLQNDLSTGDPALDAYIAELQAGQMPGTTAASAAGQVPMGTGFGVQVQMANTAPPIDVKDYIDKTLNAQYSQQNPALQQMMDAANSATQRQYQNVTLPGVNSAFTGSGLMGGSAWQEAMGNSANQYAQALSNSNANLSYEDYQSFLQNQQNALGQGTALDQTAMNNQTSINTAAIGAAGQSASAAATYQLGVQKLNQDAAIARMQALGSGIGQQMQGDQYDLTGMGNLANTYGTDQLGALNAASTVSQIPYLGYEAAGNLSEGADKDVTAQNQEYTNAQQVANNLKLGEGQIGLGKSQLAFQQQEFYDPLSRLGTASTIINNLSGRYGDTTQTQQGTDYRNVPQQSVAGQGLAGALGGSNLLGNLLSGLGGGGGGGGLPAGATPVAGQPGVYQDQNGDYMDSNGDAINPNTTGSGGPPGTTEISNGVYVDSNGDYMDANGDPVDPYSAGGE